MAWANRIQCIGVPGAKNFSPKYAPYFEKFDKIYIHSEEDSGAKTFISGISAVLPTNKLYIVNSKAIDSNCKDLADLNIHGKLNLQALLNTAVKFEPATTEEQSAVQKHVLIGQQLIELLQLKCYNNELYYYCSTDNVYKLADDKMLKNTILRCIDINAKKHLCNEVIEFVRNYLTDNGNIQIDSNYVNFMNGIYDIKNKCLLKHTSDIFTINQIHINFLGQIPENLVVDNYLDELTNYVENRKTALLQMAGYSLTAMTCIQQSQIWYGPTASNRKINIC